MKISGNNITASCCDGIRKKNYTEKEKESGDSFKLSNSEDTGWMMKDLSYTLKSPDPFKVMDTAGGIVMGGFLGSFMGGLTGNAVVTISCGVLGAAIGGLLFSQGGKGG